MYGLPNEEFFQLHASNINEILRDSKVNFDAAIEQSSTDRKVNALCEITGALEGELRFIRDAMEVQLKDFGKKKFYQFWK